MVEDTQTILQLTADELFENAWPFCGVDTESVNKSTYLTLLSVNYNLSKHSLNNRQGCTRM